METAWFACKDRLPPPGVVVDTMIVNEHGVSNENQLKLLPNAGRLWFFPDGSMYVYYQPTHWRFVQEFN